MTTFSASIPKYARARQRVLSRLTTAPASERDLVRLITVKSAEIDLAVTALAAQSILDAMSAERLIVKTFDERTCESPYTIREAS